MIQFILIYSLLLIPTNTLAVPTFGEPITAAYNSLKDFQTFYDGTKDFAGRTAKVIGVPPVILRAFSERLSQYLPKSRTHSAGCNTFANHRSDTAHGRGIHDLLLPPKTTHGQCLAPADDSSEIQWMAPHSTLQDYEDLEGLPDLEQLWEALFARDEPIFPDEKDPQLNFFFASFVNWFHDDSFRTQPGTSGTHTWTKDVGLRLSHIYGHTPERNRALRTFQDGKMKVQSIGSWDSFPPSLASIREEFPEFEMWTPQTSHLNSTAAGKTDESMNDEKYFAIGDPRFNMHPGHIMWASIGLYIHNAACDTIIKSSEYQLPEEDIFQRARVVTFHIVQKIRLHEFVSDSVAHTREHFRLFYDPPSIKRDIAKYFSFQGSGYPNFLEFNHVYQAWHSMVPSRILLKDNEVSMREVMWKPELFHDNSISDIATGFQETRITKYGAHNFPRFLKHVTIDAVANERKQRMQSYNEYRVALGLDRLRSFDDLGLEGEKLQTIRDLYLDNIDALEFLPGILLDTNTKISGNWMGDMQLILVSLFAFNDFASSDLVNNDYLWTEEYLTKGGLDMIRSFEIADLIGKMQSQPVAPCPFRTSDSVCVAPSEWEVFDKVPASFLSSEGTCSYIGIDVTAWFFDEGGYFRGLVSSVLLCMMILLLAFLGLFSAASYFWPLPVEYSNEFDGLRLALKLSDDDCSHKLVLQAVSDAIWSGRLRFVAIGANVLVTLGGFIPATIIFAKFFGDPKWLQDLTETDFLSFSFITGLAICIFFGEVGLRLGLYRFQRGGKKPLLLLFFHHFFGLLLFLYTAIATDVYSLKMGTLILTSYYWEWTIYVPVFLTRLSAVLRKSWLPHSMMGILDVVTLMVVYPVCVVLYFATRLIATVAFAKTAMCGVDRIALPDGVDYKWSFYIMTSIVAMLLLRQFSVGVDFTRTWIRLLRKLSTEARRKGARESTTEGIALEVSQRSTAEVETDNSDVSETTLRRRAIEVALPFVNC